VEHAKKGKPFDASGPSNRNQGKDFAETTRGGSDDEENEQKRALKPRTAWQSGNKF
jgi:hypothetical protein